MEVLATIGHQCQLVCLQCVCDVCMVEQSGHAVMQCDAQVKGKVPEHHRVLCSQGCEETIVEVMRSMRDRHNQQISRSGRDERGDTCSVCRSQQGCVPHAESTRDPTESRLLSIIALPLTRESAPRSPSHC